MLILEQIYWYIQIISMAWFLTHLSDFIEEFFLLLNKPVLLFNLPVKIFSCLKCSTFWTTLIITYNFPLSCFLSLIADQLDRRNIITKDIFI